MSIEMEHVYRYLSQQNLKYGNKGFWYCSAAIKAASDNPELIIKLNKIYTEISVQFKTNEKSISRAIRYTLAPLGITNKEFISKAICEIQMTESKKETKERKHKLARGA